MIRTLVLFLLVSLSISSLPAKDLLSSQISTFNETVKKVGTPDYKGNCAPLAGASFTVKKGNVYSKLNKKTIELSILSEAYAQQVFNMLKEDPEISFNYPLDGCYARAHMMAMKMDDMGIVSGKAFVEGDPLEVQTKLGLAPWSYHVASLILVNVNGKNVPTVIDPSLFDKPVSYEVWKKRLLENKQSKFVSEYFTKRFNYDPDSRFDEMEGYLEDQVEDMKEANRTNKIQGEALQRMYGEE